MKKIKMGVFGAWRGNSYIDLMSQREEIELVAICDKNIEQLGVENRLQGPDYYTDFDAFIEGGKNAA